MYWVRNMAERRMLAKTIMGSDAFLDMPLSAQALYVHLNLEADDEGFINNPKKVMRMLGAKKEDMDELVGKKFILSFPNGVVVIKHWLIHNYIPKDRFHETKYKEEKALLKLDENRSYSLTHGTCIQDVYKPYTEDRIGKDRLGKYNIVPNYDASNNPPVNEERLKELMERRKHES